MESPARQLDEEINQDNQNLKEITAMVSIIFLF
jgi:hypothetical protein